VDDKNQRIDTILDAAERVFARYGYRQSNMELLAGEAGLSRQGLYLSFRNKASIFSAIVERLQKESVERALHAADMARERGAGAVEIVVEQISGRANSFLARLKKSPYVMELYEESERLCPEIVRDYSLKFVSGVGATIAKEQRAGHLKLPRGVPADKAARLIIAFAHGIKITNPPPSPSDFKRDLEIVVSVFFRGT
jgi:AcrR family transcriptional regulator